MNKKRIVLHGALRELWDGPLEFAAESAAEAIKAFCRQTKALDPIPGRPRWRIQAVGFESPEELECPTEEKEIHLVPEFAGGKKGGVVTIVLGVALVVASFIPGINVMAWGMAGTLLFSLGSALLMSGLTSMFSKAPKREDGGNQGSSDNSRDTSRYLGAQGNTVDIGTRIGFHYGRNKLYGHFISFDIDAVDVELAA